MSNRAARGVSETAEARLLGQSAHVNLAHTTNRGRRSQQRWPIPSYVMHEDILLMSPVHDIRFFLYPHLPTRHRHCRNLALA